MRLSKPTAVLALLVTLAPLVYLVFFIGSIFVSILAAPDARGDKDWFIVLMVMHLLTMFWSIGLVAFYLIALFKLPAVPQDQKVLWAVVLIFFGSFAMLAFWWLYLWPRSAPHI